MNKKIILLSLFAVLGGLIFSQAVYAADATLSIVPASATKNVGASFNVSVNLDPQGNNVCVVKGTVSFDKLTCNSISIAPGLMAQTTPTCANPNFTLGIPKCTTSAQNLLTVSVKGNQAGAGKITLAGANVIGAGTAVASAVNGGTYSITTAPVQKPAPAPEPETVQESPVVTEQIEEKPVEEPSPVVTTEAFVPQSAAAALTMGSFFSSPIVIIVIAIILILFIVWGFDKFYKKGKKKIA